MDKKELAEGLAEHIVGRLDIDTVINLAMDCLCKSYLEYTDEQLLEAVKEYAPHVLEGM